MICLILGSLLSLFISYKVVVGELESRMAETKASLTRILDDVYRRGDLQSLSAETRAAFNAHRQSAGTTSKFDVRATYGNAFGIHGEAIVSTKRGAKEFEESWSWYRGRMISFDVSPKAKSE